MTKSSHSGGDLALLKMISRNVKRARLQAGLTQVELCDVALISQPYLSQVEAGGWNVGLVNLARIARACGVELHDIVHPLFGRKPAKSHEPVSDLDNEAHG